MRNTVQFPSSRPRVADPARFVLPDGRFARSRAVWNTSGPGIGSVKSVEFAAILWQPSPEEIAAL